MDTVVGLLALAALVAAVFLYEKVRERVDVTMNRALFRRSYRDGKAAVAEVTRFTTPVGPGETLDLIDEIINPHPQAPPLVGGLYRAYRDGTQLHLRYGNRLGDSFRMVVKVQAVGDGTRGLVHCVGWTETNGTFDGAAAIRQVHARAAAAVERLGGATISAEAARS